MEFSGRLAAFPMADLLQWAHNDQRSGALVVRRSRREKWVYFRRGEIVSCLSDDPAEFYGQYLLVRGYIAQPTLIEALSRCREQGKRLGVALSEMGALSLRVVQETLRQQIEDSVCDLFLWKHGVFYFTEESPPEESLLPEPIDAMALALEGARWVDEHQRIRQVFVNDNVVLSHGPAWPGEGLDPLQRRILDKLDGGAPLGELHGRVRGSFFRFLEAAFQLAVHEVLDIESVGEEDEEETASHELSIYDLLFEQAAQEQVMLFRRSVSLPIKLVESFYPVWVAEVPAEDSGRLPEPARDFYRRLDGQTPLRDALAADLASRNLQMELLLLQLRKGSLALLPSPISELGERAGVEQGEGPWWKKILG